jgi:hypothetical protein
MSGLRLGVVAVGAFEGRGRAMTYGEIRLQVGGWFCLCGKGNPSVMDPAPGGGGALRTGRPESAAGRQAPTTPSWWTWLHLAGVAGQEGAKRAVR